MRQTRIAWHALAALMLISPGCSDSSDTASPASTGGSAGVGGSAGMPSGGAGGSRATFADSPCASCIDSACSTFVSACEGDPGCIAYLGCVADCPLGTSGNAEDTCVAACPEPGNSVGVTLRDDYEVCRTQTAKCAECGHIVDEPHPFEGQMCSPPAPFDVCFDCVLGKCCETFDACSNSADCLAYEDCIALCFSGQCIIDCQTAHEEGAQLTRVDNACWESLCGAECIPSWNDCAQCAQDHCDLEVIACDTDPDCAKAKLCASDCLNDPTCPDHNVCTANLSPESFNLWNVERVCRSQNCSSVCR